MKKKCLYITLQPIIDGDGASDKAFAQRDAIAEIGIESHIAYVKEFDGLLSLYVDDKKITEISKYVEIYKNLLEEIILLKPTHVFIRYVGMARPCFNSFLSKVKSRGAMIFMEIPTYPYDGEIDLSSFRKAYGTLRERFFRLFLYRYVDKIVTSSLFDNIFKIPTVKISNAPAYKLPVKSIQSREGLHMIAVANLAFWHGYDRLIRGMANYYREPHDKKIYFTIVGKGNLSVYNQLVSLVKDNSLEDYVCFLGQKKNSELDKYFDEANLAIGCLGCHRKNIYEVKSLKNVEYAMRGIPFVYSESNSDFDQRPYVLRVPADDSDIQLDLLLSFVQNLNLSPSEIHDSVKEYTWGNQMKKVFCD